MAARQPSVATAVKGNPFPFHPGSRASPPASRGNGEAEHQTWHLPVNTGKKLRQTERVATATSNRRCSPTSAVPKTAPLGRGPTSQRRRRPQGKHQAFAHTEEGSESGTSTRPSRRSAAPAAASSSWLPKGFPRYHQPTPPSAQHLKSAAETTELQIWQGKNKTRKRRLHLQLWQPGWRSRLVPRPTTSVTSPPARPRMTASTEP
jgi:hypothetical protein